MREESSPVELEGPETNEESDVTPKQKVREAREQGLGRRRRRRRTRPRRAMRQRTTRQDDESGTTACPGGGVKVAARFGEQETAKRVSLEP